MTNAEMQMSRTYNVRMKNARGSFSTIVYADIPADAADHARLAFPHASVVAVEFICENDD